MVGLLRLGKSDRDGMRDLSLRCYQKSKGPSEHCDRRLDGQGYRLCIQCLKHKGANQISGENEISRSVLKLVEVRAWEKRGKDMTKLVCFLQKIYHDITNPYFDPQPHKRRGETNSTQ